MSIGRRRQLSLAELKQGFARIHKIQGRFDLFENPDSMITNPDANGCGSGFQSFLLARAGYEVIGFDIADKLLDVARMKTPYH
ncbi:MAG: methyltransferase domain-containing protein, partial [Elusimicrobia bacterium]|nr:methyltransferase domain-containing protein [Elusimicrobiota bacterium]